MTAPTAKEILTQLGYDREDTFFMSLNLTEYQLDLLQHAIAEANGGDSEESLTDICFEWLQQRKAHDNDHENPTSSSNNRAGNLSRRPVRGVPSLAVRE